MAKQLKGDINNDGKINKLDAMIVFNEVSGAITLTQEEKNRADIDSNGTIAIIDAKMILQHVSGEKLIDEVI